MKNLQTKIIKVLIFGEAGVGKTTIAQHLGAFDALPNNSAISKTFEPEIYEVFYSDLKENDFKFGLDYKLKIFDTCGLNSSQDFKEEKINLLFNFIHFCFVNQEGFTLIFYVKATRLTDNVKFNIEIIKTLYPTCPLVIINQGQENNWHSQRCDCYLTYDHDNSHHLQNYTTQIVSVDLLPIDKIKSKKEKNRWTEVDELQYKTDVKLVNKFINKYKDRDLTRLVEIQPIGAFKSFLKWLGFDFTHEVIELLLSKCLERGYTPDQLKLFKEFCNTLFGR